MKYFIDTEFREAPNTIDLISIGIKCEDGRELYNISKDFNLKKVWRDDWLRENVLREIFDELSFREYDKQMRTLGYGSDLEFNYKNMKYLIRIYGYGIEQINTNIRRFVYHPALEYDERATLMDTCVEEYLKENKIEFYGYYADYDWVVFCWIFGRMIDLPKGFPMYCKDLKQMMDSENIKRKEIHTDPATEHSAIEDARWNLKLYNYLKEK